MAATIFVILLNCVDGEVEDEDEPVCVTLVFSAAVAFVVVVGDVTFEFALAVPLTTVRGCEVIPTAYDVDETLAGLVDATLIFTTDG